MYKAVIRIQKKTKKKKGSLSIIDYAKLAQMISKKGPNLIQFGNSVLIRRAVLWKSANQTCLWDQWAGFGKKDPSREIFLKLNENFAGFPNN